MEIRFRFGKKEFNDAIDNLDAQDDRGAVIVVSSILEETLSEAILKLCVNRDKEIEGQFFKGYGPLGTFRAKIDLGFFLGFYSKEALSNFHKVREIRNKMAHKVTNLSFKHHEIKDNCQHLPSLEKIVEGWHTSKGEALKFAKTGAEHKIASYIDFIITSLQTDKKPGDRGKFMSYVENRIVSLRMICNSGLDVRVTRIIKNHS